MMKAYDKITLQNHMHCVCIVLASGGEGGGTA